MASRTASLIQFVCVPEGSVGLGFSFSSSGRRYTVPLGKPIAARNPNTRSRVIGSVEGEIGQDARVRFTDGGRPARLSSLVVDYDLTPFVVEGEALPVPRHECAEALHEGAPEDDEVTSLSTLSFDGDELEVVQIEGLGWVSLPSLLRPFGKRVDHARGLLDGWARTRLERLTGTHLQAGCARGNASDVTLLHIEDAPLLIARLDGRGMDEATKAKHARYLRHVSGVLAEHFGLRQPTPVAAIDPNLVALLKGQQDLMAQLAASTRAELATVGHRVDEALRIAEQARTMAGSRSVVDAVAQETAPGRSAETPDGAWSAKAPAGFRSMRSVARDFALPCDGAGANFVSRVAGALGVLDDPEAISLQDVVIGGTARRAHVTYGPKAIEAMRGGLRAAHAVMTSYGYTVSHGVMHPIGVGPARRAKPFVIEQMFEAAVRRPAAGGQTSIPGCERRAG